MLPPNRTGNYEQPSRTPKPTHFRPHNPISARWNSDKQLLRWRAGRADTANRHLELKGDITVRCELNRRIKADNAFLRELRRQMERITKAVLDNIPAIARALEALRQKLLMLQYQVLHYRSEAWQAAEDLRDIKPDLARFDTLTTEIKSKTAQQHSLTNEKKKTPAWSLLKKRDLIQRINTLAEELEDLCTEQTASWHPLTSPPTRT